MVKYLLVLLTAASLFAAFSFGATANIDINTANQTIRGFGGMNFPRWIGTLTNAQVDTAFGNGPGQIGLTILRIDIPPNTGNWSGEIAAAVRAKSHGAIVFASPWSPPASMKSNNSTTGGYLLPEYYAAYAAHLRDFANYLSTNGASLYAVSVQNEPDWLPDYESCGWTPTEMRTFLDNNASIIPVKVIAPETVQPKDNWYNALSSSPELDIYADHLYGKGPVRYNKEHWMTEHYTTSDVSGDLWPDALAVGTEIHNCMVNNYNAYVWWYIRRSYGPIAEDGHVTKRGYVMSHFSKFVRPGFVRVNATANPASGVYVSAYVNGDTLVIVAVNQNTSPVDLTFALSSGSVSSYTRYDTSATSSMQNMGAVGSANTISPGSISTFVGTVSRDLPTQAANPTPAHGAAGVSVNAGLGWTAGPGEVWHHVYFGTNPAPGSSEYQGVRAETTFNPGILDYGTTYYWRIDEENAKGVTTGNVWSFATAELLANVEILAWATGTTHAKQAGANRALVFVAHGEKTIAMSLDAVTYGGQPMTKIIDTNYSASGAYAYVAAFCLNEAGIAAASGQTFTPTWGSAPTETKYASVFLSGVNQAMLTGQTQAAGGTTATIATAPLSANSGDMVIGAATCGNLGAYSFNNGFLEGTNNSSVSSAGATCFKQATGASETPSVTHNSVNRQALIGFVVNAAGMDLQICRHVQAAGLGLLSDLTGDCYVNLSDLQVMAMYWLEDNCGVPDNCQGADFAPTDGAVNIEDFSRFAAQWLECNDPQDSNCP